jgi:hypothetical protein
MTSVSGEESRYDEKKKKKKVSSSKHKKPGEKEEINRENPHGKK